VRELEQIQAEECAAAVKDQHQSARKELGLYHLIALGETVTVAPGEGAGASSAPRCDARDMYQAIVAGEGPEIYFNRSNVDFGAAALRSSEGGVRLIRRLMGGRIRRCTGLFAPYGMLFGRICS
jgi:hypothetical protein